MNIKLISGVIVAGVLLAGIATARGKGQDASQKAVSQGDIADALRTGGLHKAAVVSGGFYRRTYNATPDHVVSNLTALAGAEAVLIGEIMTNQSHLSKDGSYATTEFHFRVLEPISGTLVEGASGVVSLVGGRVMFEDGTSAQVDVPGYVPPNAGDRFVMFLDRIQNDHLTEKQMEFASGSTIFRPRFGAIGMYLLPPTDDGKVKPSIRSSQPLIAAIKNKDVKEFLKDVRKAVADAAKEKTASPKGH
jgi:hypothetical protein